MSLKSFKMMFLFSYAGYIALCLRRLIEYAYDNYLALLKEEL